VRIYLPELESQTWEEGENISDLPVWRQAGYHLSYAWLVILIVGLFIQDYGSIGLKRGMEYKRYLCIC
jgi:hypothetical protein